MDTETLVTYFRVAVATRKETVLCVYLCVCVKFKWLLVQKRSCIVQKTNQLEGRKMKMSVLSHAFVAVAFFLFALSIAFLTNLLKLFLLKSLTSSRGT